MEPRGPHVQYLRGAPGRPCVKVVHSFIRLTSQVLMVKDYRFKDWNSFKIICILHSLCCALAAAAAGALSSPLPCSLCLNMNINRT